MIRNILLIPIIGIVAISLGLLFKGIDRILAARMQARIGPPLTQPFRDVKKLLLKETIVPETAIPWLFNLVPLISLSASLMILLYIPFGSFNPILSGYGDLILIIYLLTIPSIALVIAGFSSGSPYASIGAQREMVSMMSYELPLVTVIFTLAWRLSNEIPGAGVFSLFVMNQNPIFSLVGPLGVIGLILLLLVLLFVVPGELSNVPLDVPEAETEIAGGLLTEYSGRNFALFYIGDAVKTIAIMGLIIALFFPYNISQLITGDMILSQIVNLLFFLLKIFLLMFISVTIIRIAMARLRITQIVYVYWMPLTVMGLLGLVFIFLDSLMT